MNESNDRAQLAHLKHVFLGELDDGERVLLEAFERTPEGREFAASTARLREQLARVATIEAQPIRATELRARFEERLRAEARDCRRRFVPFCLAVFGLFGTAALAATWALRSSPRAERLPDLWILLGLGALAICTAVGLRTWRLLRTPDLACFLSEARGNFTRGRLWSMRAVLVAFVCAALLAPSWGWPRAVGLAVLSLVAMRGAAVALDGAQRRRRMREDEEMWAWWYRGAERR